MEWEELPLPHLGHPDFDGVSRHRRVRVGRKPSAATGDTSASVAAPAVSPRLLCDYMFPGAEQALCWLPYQHDGQHLRKYEVEGLRKEWFEVLRSEGVKRVRKA